MSLFRVIPSMARSDTIIYRIMKRMRKFILGCLACLGILPVSASVNGVMNEPDSVYLFSYCTTFDEGKSGLKFAWSQGDDQWFSVGNDWAYVKSDFGPWGSFKNMYKPHLQQSKEDGTWYCTWYLTKEEDAMAKVASKDLLKWKSQQYFMSSDKGKYAEKNCYPTEEKTIVLNGQQLTGWAQKVAYKQVLDMIRFAEHKMYRAQLNDERTEQDGVRFAGLKPVEVSVKVNGGKSKPISEHLIGIFFEDINYAADGGLYAELVQNRDFEYSSNDRRNWNNKYAWSIKNGKADLTIGVENPIHANNSHYAVLDVQQPGAALVNEGFDGIVVKKGEKYDFSLFGKMLEGKGGLVRVAVLNKDGKEIAQSKVKITSADWKKQKTVLTATEDAADAVLAVIPQTGGKYALDMISLFPQNTFKGRKNGLRADLAQTLADMKPRFVRFPGGCVAHGDGIDNIYDWKGSVGALEERKPLRNLWGYHQTRGLGYFEYFQFCEDIGAEPVPVVAAGLPCQNSGTCAHHSHNLVTCKGQQGGIPMDEMDEYIQDVLDLIEYANGDAKKTKWGKKRAEAGHPKPFNLKYIGIGNEDMITEVFVERFTMIYNVVKEKHPEVTIIGTVGPFYEGTDYEEGWELATKMGIPMVDEHYYNTPGWFINNQDFYDRYDRNKSKVYLGEYAAHLPGRPNNIETALAEALYLTSVERNADVVTMTSYAPLLAKEGHTQWNPDLIYFNNTEVKPTVGYYTQLLYGQNAGTEYLPSEVQVKSRQDAVKKRISVSVVRDEHTSDLIVKMVNLLPVSAKADIALPSLDGMNKSAKKIVLAGDPKDKNARPVESAIEVNESFAYELPAYSFTVIRIQKETIKKK